MRPDRRKMLLSLAALPSALLVAKVATAAQPLPKVQVWKTPTCGCCGAWVDHMRASGFEVEVNDVPDTAATRLRLGIPADLGSCHTALVAGYALEGHVPASDVKRLLRTKPKAVGLTVPGMPVGSPGMEMGPRVDPFEVLLVQRNGQTSVFARYPKRQA